MTYNYGRFIEEAIKGVLCQDFKEWELIISDDNSSDDTFNIVKKYLSDSRITYIKHDKNLGQAGNWNYLLKTAKTEFFVLLHADDYWLPGIISKAISFFRGFPDCDMAIFNWKFLIEMNERKSFQG